MAPIETLELFLILKRRLVRIWSACRYGMNVGGRHWQSVQESRARHPGVATLIVQRNETIIPPKPLDAIPRKFASIGFSGKPLVNRLRGRAACQANCDCGPGLRNSGSNSFDSNLDERRQIGGHDDFRSPFGHYDLS